LQTDVKALLKAAALNGKLQPHKHHNLEIHFTIDPCLWINILKTFYHLASHFRSNVINAPEIKNIFLWEI